jgi:chloride channel protein, CIC family
MSPLFTTAGKRWGLPLLPFRGAAPSSASAKRALKHVDDLGHVGTVSRNRAPVRRRRSPLAALLHAPQVLRALVRADETWLVVLAAFVGAITGVIVHCMTATAQFLHVLLFGVDMDQHLSATAHVAPLQALLVPPLGGLAFGLFSLGVARIWPRQAVDPIEANALYGGRMSLRDSVKVMLQTIFSNGVGASIGLEAGYTQMGAGIASRLGREFRCAAASCV